MKIFLIRCKCGREQQTTKKRGYTKCFYCNKSINIKEQLVRRVR